MCRVFPNKSWKLYDQKIYLCHIMYFELQSSTNIYWICMLKFTIKLYWVRIVVNLPRFLILLQIKYTNIVKECYIEKCSNIFCDRGSFIFIVNRMLMMGRSSNENNLFCILCQVHQVCVKYCKTWNSLNILNSIFHEKSCWFYRSDDLNNLK